MIDEAHTFAPEGMRSETAEAVVNLCSRGRKRGFAPVLATQRLANLSKQAAAQLANSLIGPTTLDTDRKRGLLALGVSGAAARRIDAQLLGLRPGQFYATGPAISPQGLSLVEVGPVVTHHPEIARGRQAPPGPPPPAETVRAVLARLADLAQEAEAEASEVEALRTRVKQLTVESEEAKRRRGEEAGGMAGAAAETEAAWRRRMEERDRQWAAREMVYTEQLARLRDGVTRAGDALAVATAAAATEVPERPRAEPRLPPPAAALKSRSRGAEKGAGDSGEYTGRRGAGRVSPPSELGSAPRPTRAGSGDPALHALRAGARRMLEVLVRHHPMVMTVAQWATLSGFSARGGTFQAYARDLRHAELVVVDGREVQATPAGVACYPEAALPMGTHEVLEVWRHALRAGARRMLDLLVEAYPGGMSRAELAERSGFAESGGTYQAYLRDLRRNLLAIERDGEVCAAEVLFGVGSRG